VHDKYKSEKKSHATVPLRFLFLSVSSYFFFITKCFLSPLNSIHDFLFLKLDYQGRVVSTVEDETAVQFQPPRTRQTRATEADEPQPSGSRKSSRKRRASAAAVVTIAAQVDEPQPGGSREPFRKRRASAAAAVTVAGPLDDEDEQEDDDITGIPAPERLAR
jgi:hypothetical protein